MIDHHYYRQMITVHSGWCESAIVHVHYDHLTLIMVMTTIVSNRTNFVRVVFLCVCMCVSVCVGVFNCVTNKMSVIKKKK